MDELYARARSVLLDALEALEEQREAIVLVGAQAIYLYTGESDVPITTRTKDSDIALDPDLVQIAPLLEIAMEEAGFHLNLENPQPGQWLSEDGVPIDVLVPGSLVEGGRGAQMPPHAKNAARRVNGLEAAVVDNRLKSIEGVDSRDSREFDIKVAGPAALVVSKAHKLGERASQPSRLVDKDAHDSYRLLRAVETGEVVQGFRELLSDRRSRDVARQALEYLNDLFATPDALGAQMAGRTELHVGDPEVVAASVSALVNDLLAGLTLVSE